MIHKSILPNGAKREKTTTEEPKEGQGFAEGGGWRV
jgi:hypothetical protein